MSVVTQLKRSWRAELPVLDIIRIPPAANSSGGCTRATRASATASTRVSPLFADFCSQILPTVVLHQREANASHYTRCPLANSEFRRAAPSEFAKLPPPDETRCAIIRGSVEPWRFIVPRFPHSARMKSSQETFGWRDMREREKKGRGKNRSRIRSLRIERRTRTSRPFFRYLFFQRFMLHYLKLADMNGWEGKLGFEVGYRTMTQSKFRLFCRYFF